MVGLIEIFWISENLCDSIIYAWGLCLSDYYAKCSQISNMISKKTICQKFSQSIKGFTHTCKHDKILDYGITHCILHIFIKAENTTHQITARPDTNKTHPTIPPKFA